jgi:hypothetical protein
MDDLWRSRLRVDASTPPDAGRARRGTPSFVGLVTSTGTLAVGKFVTVAPVALTGTEADGSTGTATVGGGPVIAYPVGPGVPTTGDLVVCRRVDYRWVFDKFGTGGGGVILPTGCAFRCSLTFADIMTRTFSANVRFFADNCLFVGPSTVFQTVSMVPAHTTSGGVTTPLWTTGIQTAPAIWNYQYTPAQFNAAFCNGGVPVPPEGRGVFYKIEMGCFLVPNGQLYDASMTPTLGPSSGDSSRLINNFAPFNQCTPTFSVDYGFPYFAESDEGSWSAQIT